MTKFAITISETLRPSKQDSPLCCIIAITNHAIKLDVAAPAGLHPQKVAGLHLGA
jgi:hypothetical protein